MIKIEDFNVTNLNIIFDNNIGFVVLTKKLKKRRIYNIFDIIVSSNKAVLGYPKKISDYKNLYYKISKILFDIYNEKYPEYLVNYNKPIRYKNLREFFVELFNPIIINYENFSSYSYPRYSIIKNNDGLFLWRYIYVDAEFSMKYKVNI